MISMLSLLTKSLFDWKRLCGSLLIHAPQRLCSQLNGYYENVSEVGLDGLFT